MVAVWPVGVAGDFLSSYTKVGAGYTTLRIPLKPLLAIPLVELNLKVAYTTA